MSKTRELSNNMAISYLRVSTRRQGESRLSLEKQRSANREYAKQRGLQILKEYMETESGETGVDRPVLLSAVGHAVLSNACILVYYVDRLCRSIDTFDMIRAQHKIHIIDTSKPKARSAELRSDVSEAERELGKVSRRTKEALSMKKIVDEEKVKEKEKLESPATPTETTPPLVTKVKLPSDFDQVTIYLKDFSDKMSPSELASYLNERNYKGASGGKITTNTIVKWQKHLGLESKIPEKPIVEEKMKLAPSCLPDSAPDIFKSGSVFKSGNIAHDVEEVMKRLDSLLTI